MSLNVEMGQRLDASSSITAFQVNSAGALGEMDSVSLPDMTQDYSAAQAHGASIDLSSVTSAIDQVLSDLTPVIGSLPVAGDLLGPVSGAIDLADRLTELDLPDSVTGLAEIIEDQMSGSGDFLAKLNQFSELLKGNSSLQAVQSFVTGLAEITGINLNVDDFKTPNLLPGVEALIQSVGGLMSLQHGLEEASRLARVIKVQLDADNIGAGVLQVEQQLALGGSDSLSGFIRNMDITDATQVTAAKLAIGNAATPVIALHQAIARGMAFGEATLVQLDPDGLKSAIQRTSLQIDGLDLSPLESGITQLAERLRPVFSIDIGSAPATSLDAWLTRLEDLVGSFAGDFSAFDIDSLTAPVTRGIEAVMEIPSALNRALAELRLTMQQGLDSIRTAIEAVPVQTVANMIRQVLAPIAEALGFIADMVGRIQAALTTAMSVLQGALNTAELAVDTVKQELENVFQVARTYVEKLNLEQVIGEVSEQIQNFAQVLSQADMSPYFETVTDVIDTTTSVVDKVPFNLLPDSMEQEVVDVIRPVKQVDVEAFMGDVKAILQIGPDGKFELRPELENALSGIQAKFEELIAVIRAGDPALLLADINSELDGLKQKLAELTPDVALQPVQDVIDQVKAAVGGFNLNQALQPLNDGFEDVLARIDEFKPSLNPALQEAEQKLTEARDAVFGSLQLERWTEELTALRTHALSLIKPLDSSRIEPLLQTAVDEIRTQAENLPRLELGYLVGSLVSSVLGGSAGQLRADGFAVVLEWMQNRNGTAMLTGLAAKASQNMETAYSAVQQVDPQAITLRLQPAINEVRNAVASLPDGPVKTELMQCANTLDLERRLAGFASHRQRYLGALQRASQQFTVLSGEGLSEVDVTVERLLVAFQPLQFARDFLREVLAVVGIQGLENGLLQVVNNTFEIATPARLAAILAPLFDSFKARVEALLDGFLNPVIGAVADLQLLKDQLSMAGLIAELDEIHAAARGQVERLHPDAVLGDTVTAFNETQAQVLAFDPLGPINDALTALRDSSTRVLGKLDAEEILKTPLEVYEDIVGALESINVQNLLAPILDMLDSISEKVSTGLTQTGSSFKRLQGVLPDQVGSTSISASASVST